MRQASNVHIHNAVSTLNSPIAPRSFSSKAAAAPNNDYMCGDIDTGALTRAVDAAEARAAAGRAASFNAPTVHELIRLTPPYYIVHVPTLTWGWGDKPIC